MSTKTKDIEAEAKLPDPNEEVAYNAPLLPGRTQKDIFVCVNGESLRLKRGMTHKIKRKFAEALDNANAQTMAIYNTIDETKKKGEKPLAEM